MKFIYSTCLKHGNRNNSDISSNSIIDLLCELFLFLFHFDLWTIEKRIKYTKLIINYKKKAGSFRSKFLYRDIRFLFSKIVWCFVVFWLSFYVSVNFRFMNTAAWVRVRRNFVRCSFFFQLEIQLFCVEMKSEIKKKHFALWNRCIPYVFPLYLYLSHTRLLHV